MCEVDFAKDLSFSMPLVWKFKKSFESKYWASTKMLLTQCFHAYLSTSQFLFESFQTRADFVWSFLFVGGIFLQQSDPTDVQFGLQSVNRSIVQSDRGVMSASMNDVHKMLGLLISLILVTVTKQLILFLLSAFWGSRWKADELNLRK